MPASSNGSGGKGNNGSRPRNNETSSFSPGSSRLSPTFVNRAGLQRMQHSGSGARNSSNTGHNHQHYSTAHRTASRRSDFGSDGQPANHGSHGHSYNHGYYYHHPQAHHPAQPSALRNVKRQAESVRAGGLSSQQQASTSIPPIPKQARRAYNFAHGSTSAAAILGSPTTLDDTARTSTGDPFFLHNAGGTGGHIGSSSSLARANEEPGIAWSDSILSPASVIAIGHASLGSATPWAEKAEYELSMASAESRRTFAVWAKAALNFDAAAHRVCVVHSEMCKIRNLAGLYANGVPSQPTIPQDFG